MNDITGFVENIADQLGRTFLFTGFLPMIIFVSVNQYVFFAPPYTGAVFNLFATVPADSPLLGLANVVLTPHTAGMSQASVQRVKTEVGQAAAAVLSGRWPKSVVNPNVRPRVPLARG